MPRFSYRAKQGPERTVRGFVEAADRKRALEILRGRGAFATSIEEVSHPSEDRVRRTDVVLFTRQLADLLDSGVPLLKSLDLLRAQSDYRGVAALISRVRSDVAEGESLSQALTSHPRVFPPIYIHALRAGELGGKVPAVLDQLAGYFEREAELRVRLLSAAAYPSVVALVGAGTVVFLLSFVIPRLGDIFGEMGPSLPWITRAMLRLSAHWGASWGGWVLGAFLAAGFIHRLNLLGGFSRRLPVWRVVAQKAALSRFAATFGMLVGSGVPLLDALRVSSNGLNHPSLEMGLRESADAVENGTTVGEALRGRVPEFMRSMIAVGEESGRLEGALRKVSKSYDRELNRAVRFAGSLIEPALILCVGSVVGLMVLAMLLPILQIHELVK